MRFVSGNQNGEYAVMEDIHKINKEAGRAFSLIFTLLYEINFN